MSRLRARVSATKASRRSWVRFLCVRITTCFCVCIYFWVCADHPLAISHLLQLRSIGKCSMMGECALFEADAEDYLELESLAGMYSHQR